MTGREPRVLMIGLDAAEPSLIERWTDDGSLPTLATLRRRGCYRRLHSSAEWLVGSPWPTFYTSTNPGEHGFYHYLGWRPDLMAAARPASAQLPLSPFWRELSRRGPRVLAIDIPLTYAPEPFNGIEVTGYGTHELLEPPATYPASLRNWILRDVGPPPRTDERYVLESWDGCRKILDDQLGTVESVGELAVRLLSREPWDLALIGFGATHRVGHRLWNDTSIAGGVPDDARERFRGAVRETYRACDQAIGRLMQFAGADTVVMVFSVHGMGPDTCRTDILPQLLDRILSGSFPQSESRSTRRRLTERMRGLVPESLRHAVKRRMPLQWQDKLTAYWRMRGLDWNATRAVSLVADLQGYVRINLKGRESRGIVEPGAQYDAVCSEIERGLRSFSDADTGAPLVSDIVRADRLYPTGARTWALPDLIVRWSDYPAAEHRELHSPHFGSVAWPTPGGSPSGRSGNHRPEGLLIAAGPGFDGGWRPTYADIMDLAPTVYRLLDLEVPATFQGRSLV